MYHLKLIVLFRLLNRVVSLTIGALLLTSLVAWHYHESETPFLLPAVVAGGLLLISYVLLHKGGRPELTRKEAYVSVASSWVVISLLGAIPYLLSGYVHSFTDAFFESVSGFTTTGSSIIVDIEALPHSLLFWRSLTHWIGGIGIIMLVLVVSPSLKVGNFNLFSLESSLKEKLKPRFKAMGYRLLAIYLALTLLEVIFLLLGRMDLFNSVCHSFATVATGGFSTQNTSIAAYSPYIQYVITVFMILAGTNFALYFYMAKGDFKSIRRNEEYWFYLKVVGIMGLIVTAILYTGSERTLEVSFREAYFQTASIITCTGFATSDYLQWPPAAAALIFLMLFIGGSTGSTSGGIKMARHLIAIRNLKRTFRTAIHPNGVFNIRLNNTVLSEGSNHSLMSFIMMYILVFIAGTLLLLFTGMDGISASSAIATAMGGIGPGFGSVGPVSNFYHLASASKLILVVFMLLGRLEIYSFLVIFTPDFWRR